MIALPPSGVATLFVSASAPCRWPDCLLRRPRSPSAEVVDDDTRATFGEKERVLPAESPARAGDDRDPVVESQLTH
jgi:hypothetical protein